LKKKKKIGNVGVKMSQKTPQRNREKLSQLSTGELIEMILTQQKLIENLKQEIERLKVSRDLDSQISSKPPSSDLLKKSDSMKRFQDTANYLTAIQTCRFQDRSVMDFLASALKASVGIEEQPSLIPHSDT
jgi:hypothetical protein